MWRALSPLSIAVSIPRELIVAVRISWCSAACRSPSSSAFSTPTPTTVTAARTIRNSEMARRVRSERKPAEVSYNRANEPPGELRARDGRPLGGLSRLVAEAVAHAAHREEVLRVLRVRLQLLAQVADVDVDRARVAVGRVAPDPRQQHVAREDAARVAGQSVEDLELDERQLDRRAADPDRALGRVDLQLVDGERQLVLV